MILNMNTASEFSLNNKGGHVKVCFTCLTESEILLLCWIIMDKALMAAGRQRELGSRQPVTVSLTGRALPE